MSDTTPPWLNKPTDVPQLQEPAKRGARKEVEERVKPPISRCPVSTENPIHDSQFRYASQTESHQHRTAPSMIGSNMSISEIVTRLGQHGCPNITHLLDASTSSTWPVSSGGFGDIYKVKTHDSTQMAVKTTRMHVSSSPEVQRHLKHAARELYTWSKCEHPNVLKLFGLAVFRGQIGMVSPWMEHGSLPAYLARNPTADRCKLVRYICKGLSYLHDSGVVHGDLKGLNVLISSSGVPMLTDFGNAVLSHQSLGFTDTTSSASISLRWTAPELFEAEGECARNKEGDIYALGMTILETITGKVPYAGKSERAVLVCVLKSKPPDRPQAISVESEQGDTLWSLLVRCWSSDPTQRPTAINVAVAVRDFSDSKLCGEA